MAVPVCRVCGTDIEDAPRLCPRCDTPHHPDCWTYTGKCSVYGCGGGEVVAIPASRAITLPADVPVAGAASSAIWHADENGAWIGRPDPAISVLPGEHVVMLPPSAASHFGGEGYVAAAITAAALVACGCAVLLGGAIGSGVALIAGTVGAMALANRCGAFTVPLPDLVWFARGPGGFRLCTLRQGKQSDSPLSGAHRPGAVILSRSFQDAQDGSNGTLLTFDLHLYFPGDRGQRVGPSRIALAPPLQMPDRAPERRPLLEVLVAYRALGHHIADLLQLPFEEGASR